MLEDHCNIPKFKFQPINLHEIDENSEVFHESYSLMASFESEEDSRESSDEKDGEGLGNGKDDDSANELPKSTSTHQTF